MLTPATWRILILVISVLVKDNLKGLPQFFQNKYKEDL